MERCSICGRTAVNFIGQSWFCELCAPTAIHQPAQAAPWGRVSFYDEAGRRIQAPICSVCQDRIALFVIGDTAICRDCSAAGEDLPECESRFESVSGGADKPKRPYKGTSVIDFPHEYICVDVETTGRDPSEDEIIEVAALHVRDGEICGQFTSLIRPARSHVPLSYREIREMGYDSFHDVPYRVFEGSCGNGRRILPSAIEKLTGITDEMLLNAPAADTVIPAFYRFAGQLPLVGHSADFDVNFLYDACQRCGFSLRNNYIDTLRIARNLLPQLEHHRLSDVASHFGIKQDTAHRAAADAAAAADCLEAMKSLVLREKTISEYVRDFADPERRTPYRSRKTSYTRNQFLLSDLTHPDAADPSHPLYGQSIVFTGDLSLPRRDAAQMAANAGAVVKTAVSRKTNFLVVGQQNMSLVDGSGMSAKEKKAHEINSSGKGSIQILSEQEFITLVNSRKEAGIL